jgi:Abnormal spindle-like microcephaly-assoc'd, ASPM-SPD-2-Hydin
MCSLCTSENFVFSCLPAEIGILGLAMAKPATQEAEPFPNQHSNWGRLPPFPKDSPRETKTCTPYQLMRWKWCTSQTFTTVQWGLHNVSGPASPTKRGAKSPTAERAVTEDELNRKASKRDALVLIFTFLIFLIVLAGPTDAQTLYEATSTYSLFLSPSPLGFGTVSIGSSLTKTETISNSGSRKVIITGATATGTGFSITYHPPFPYTLSSGTKVAFRMKFAPQAIGTVSGRLTVHYKYLRNGSWTWTSRAVQLAGNGSTSLGSLVANPTSIRFGTVQTSTVKTVSETLTNSGTGALTIAQILATGTGFGFSGINPPVTLSPSQSATFNVSFKPQTSGSVTGKLTISSNASNSTLSVALTGTGAVPGQIGVSPSSVNFGNVVVGTRKSQAATISASGGPLTVSAANVSGSEFSVTGLVFPFTLNAGQSASYNLNFAPTASGSTSATVTWISSASNSVKESLTGSGTPAPTHSVTLTWNASTSANVVGYNIYRGSQSGGPYTQINTSLDSATHDVDSNVQSGHTYYYVVTAVNSARAESAYSNQIKAVTPYP